MIYIDTNIYYTKYCPVEDSESVDWIFDQLTPEFSGISNELIIAELFRAFKKQVNLGVINEKDAVIAVDFLIADIRERVELNIVHLIPIKLEDIFNTRSPIFGENLYAMDSLHAVCAERMKVKAFLTFDSDFKKNWGDIKLLNPTQADFKSLFLELKNN